MRSVVTLIWLILLGQLLSSLAVPSGIIASPFLVTEDVFSKVKPVLIKKTQVPVRLPAFLPDGNDKENPIYAILESADRNGYDVQLAWAEDCDGGNYCHYGNVRGSTGSIVQNEGKRIPLTLQGGIKGYFISATCGAHCDDSSIGWSEKGYHYSIDVKAGRMKEMIRMANSAIITGRKMKE